MRWPRMVCEDVKIHFAWPSDEGHRGSAVLGGSAAGKLVIVGADIPLVGKDTGSSLITNLYIPVNRLVSLYNTGPMHFIPNSDTSHVSRRRTVRLNHIRPIMFLLRRLQSCYPSFHLGHETDESRIILTLESNHVFMVLVDANRSVSGESDRSIWNDFLAYSGLSSIACLSRGMFTLPMPAIGSSS